MKLVVIFGPPAVGKMTVGFELAKLTGLKLFHNHMTIDLVLNFFDWDAPQFALSGEFRNRIFEEVAASQLPGLIFTYVWALDQPGDKAYVDAVAEIFKRQGADVFYVELQSDLKTRLERNNTAFRLSQKPSKRNLQQSEQAMLEHEKRYKMNSKGDFFHENNYLKIINDTMSPLNAAKRIVDHFHFKTQVAEEDAAR